MFVVFEGIDGSGKTTISNRVADQLRAAGLQVHHAREAGTFTSTAAQAIRELGRDARNLLLSPLSELLLYAARDGQSLEEQVLPALGQADVVLADRYIYSAEILATAGRGLPLAEVRSVLAPIAAKIRPDLAILVDVDPDLARVRRRVSKLVVQDRRPSSRKGLTGAGLQQRLRRAHRELAEQDPERWLIVENDDVDLSDVVEGVTLAIVTAAKQGVAAGLAAGRARLPRSTPLAHPTSRDEARAALLAWSDARAVREPQVAAYVLGGLAGEDADLRRRALVDRAAAAVAASLQNLPDAMSMHLRRELASIAPDPVARSLGGLVGDDTWTLRNELAAVAPEAVASSLGGLDDPRAWALRDRLLAVVPGAVAASMGRIASERADTVRRHRIATPPASYEDARVLAKMANGLGGALAWRLRELAFPLAPVDAITSLDTVDDDEAWRWRDRYAEPAPRTIAESLTLMTQPHAWALRDAQAERCREMFDSFVGVDAPEAWTLRERLADTWPASVCKSLGMLATSPRGASMVTSLLAAHRGLTLWRNACRMFLA